MNYNYQLDKEEQEILDAFEAGNLEKLENEEDYKMLLRETAKNSIAQREFINIPMTRGDLYVIKEKAQEAGIPYETFISLFLHKHFQGSSVSA